MEQRKLIRAGESVNWCHHFGEQFGKVKTRVLCSHRQTLKYVLEKTCTRFIIALFVRVQKWKQPKRLSVEEWINDGIFIQWNSLQQLK